MVHVPWHEEIQASIEEGTLTELEGYESVTLLSVGIDIGTTTTHLVFSELQARRKGGQYSSEFHVTDREVIYESPIALTPYKDRTTIVTTELAAFIEESYGDAGYTEEDVDTGAVITTGEASRKENAEAITEHFSDEERLPLRNVPMVPFVVDRDDDPAALKEDVLEKLSMYDIDDLDGPFAFGLHLHGHPSYDFYEMIGSALIAGWREFDGVHPLIVAFDSDVARNAGKHIAGRIERPVISVDGVTLDQFGYIDIGEPIEKTNAVPITVKSLLFEG